MLIQNTFGLGLYRYLHVIHCTYDFNTKTTSNTKLFKIKVTQNFKIYTFIIYHKFTFVHPHKYLHTIHPINNLDTETSLCKKKDLNTNISKNFVAHVLKHHMHLKKT